MPDNNSTVQDGPLTIRLVDEGRRLRLALQGEIDLSNAKTAEAQLMGAFESGKKILVDLGKLEFLDSTGIALLVMALRRPDAARLSFLPSETAGVRRLLNLTGLDAKLPFAAPEQSRPATGSQNLLPTA